MRNVFLSAACRWLIAVVMLLGTASLSARADITIKFDDLKNGDKISDVAVIVVHADSGDGIDKVEFAVDDQLRFSSGSTPYTFKWDTIPETEGAHNLVVTAIDATGQKKTEKLSLTIDNQLSLGAPALAAKAREALEAKDLNTAMRYSRRALKANSENIDAACALAAIEADRMGWDRAINTLEKNKNLSGSVNGMVELANYHMQRAVLPENSANLVADIETAEQLRRKAAELAVEEVKAKNLPADVASTHEQLGDALVNAGRFRRCDPGVLQIRGQRRPTSVNRLALAYVLHDQPLDAYVLLRPMVRDKTGDAASRAVMGLALLRLRRFNEVQDVVKADLGSSRPASLVVAAYSDAVAGKDPAAVQEAREAVEALPQAGEAHYALSMGEAKVSNSEPEVLKALSLSPFQSGPIIDYAVRYAMIQQHPNRFETALKLLDFVLKPNPENRTAQLAKVLLLFHSNSALPRRSRYLPTSPSTMRSRRTSRWRQRSIST